MEWDGPSRKKFYQEKCSQAEDAHERNGKLDTQIQEWASLPARRRNIFGLIAVGRIGARHGGPPFEKKRNSHPCNYAPAWLIFTT